MNFTRNRYSEITIQNQHHVFLGPMLSVLYVGIYAFRITGNPPVSGGFLSHGPVMRTFGTSLMSDWTNSQTNSLNTCFCHVCHDNDWFALQTFRRLASNIAKHMCFIIIFVVACITTSPISVRYKLNKLIVLDKLLWRRIIYVNFLTVLRRIYGGIIWKLLVVTVISFIHLKLLVKSPWNDIRWCDWNCINPLSFEHQLIKQISVNTIWNQTSSLFQSTRFHLVISCWFPCVPDIYCADILTTRAWCRTVTFSCKTCLKHRVGI